MPLSQELDRRILLVGDDRLLYASLLQRLHQGQDARIGRGQDRAVAVIPGLVGPQHLGGLLLACPGRDRMGNQPGRAVSEAGGGLAARQLRHVKFPQGVVDGVGQVTQGIQHRAVHIKKHRFISHVRFLRLTRL